MGFDPAAGVASIAARLINMQEALNATATTAGLILNDHYGAEAVGRYAQETRDRLNTHQRDIAPLVTECNDEIAALTAVQHAHQAYADALAQAHALQNVLTQVSNGLRAVHQSIKVYLRPSYAAACDAEIAAHGAAAPDATRRTIDFDNA